MTVQEESGTILSSNGKTAITNCSPSGWKSFASDGYRVPLTVTGYLRCDRLDPIALLEVSSRGRLPHLVPLRYGRMLKSPFTFLRGAAIVMAADLATTPTIGVRVQAGGDCHLLNFGGYGTPERNLVFDVNDFDDTLPAP